VEGVGWEDGTWNQEDYAKLDTGSDMSSSLNILFGQIRYLFHQKSYI
jgi:hypothetical protein